MSAEIIKNAIASRHLIEFHYDSGSRVVEPHMLAINEAGHYALSGWFVRGFSKSWGQGWREYLLAGMGNVTILNEKFPAPRPGYNPAGGTKFPTVIARL